MCESECVWVSECMRMTFRAFDFSLNGDYFISIRYMCILNRIANELTLGVRWESGIQNEDLK